MADSGKSGKRQRSIRNFIIEPMAQIRMGVQLLMITLAFLAVMIVVISSGFYAQYTLMVQTNQLTNDSPLSSAMMEVFIRHSIALSLVFGTFILVLMGAVIITTHRIYGAVIALRRFINDLSQGNYAKRCQLRAHDELQEMAADLNALAQTLEGKYGSK